MPEEPIFFAKYSEKSEEHAQIILWRKKLSDLHIDTVFTSILSLERRMLINNAFVLHCAYVRYRGEAILFSAPSETGKTTQANLWEKYRGSRTINGDRSLLRFEKERLLACGWPVCGTSGICENQNTMVRTIVMLKQGNENTVRELLPREAFSLLYSQITINSWNQDFINKAIDFIEMIIQRVPVYELSCTISEEAVTLLERTLYPA